MLPFAAAKAFVRKLELKGETEWQAWCKSGKRPFNIPSSPHKTYRDDGWISMPDWLGYTGRAQHKDMLPFAAARAIVRKLKLKSQKEWNAWSKSGQRPSTIPSLPPKTYRDDGWISWPDWLGYKGQARGKMLPFAVARAIVRKLNLKNQKEWFAWSKSGQRPSNIPGNPHKVYRDDGWISTADWLGYEGRALPGNMFPFAVARAIVRKLKLKNQKEWVAWRKSGQRPSNIPSNPDKTYRDDGWISWPDWLGYGSEGGVSGSGSSSSRSSSSTSTAPKKKKKRKRRPAAPHPDAPPPPAPPASHPKRRIKTEEPRPGDTSGDPTSTADDPPLHKIKKEEDA
jgi:hypothetical protein